MRLPQLPALGITQKTGVALKRSRTFFEHDIWQPETFGRKDPTAIFYAVLRLLAIILRGITQNKILNQAASMGYYSLIAFGPMLAMIVMISSFVFQGSEEDIAGKALSKMVIFIAPPAAEFTRLEMEETQEALEEGRTPDEGKNAEQQFNPQLISFINNLVSKARSGTMGVVGTLILVGISIQLLTSIERIFNNIWGAKQGRSWGQRIILYWTLLSLGAILGFTAFTLLSAVKVAKLLDNIPFGLSAIKAGPVLLPFLSYLMITLLLACFYRFMPNASVKWKPALAGGFIVTILLWLNNGLSFLYVSKVLRTKSLYGSIGIVPILMFGLFIFWLFVLLGGQITYSIQNANFLAHQRAWRNSSIHTREMLSFTTFILIARRFLKCEAPYSINDLGKVLQAPTHTINQCLSWMTDRGWVSTVLRKDNDDDPVTCYQPGRPLQSICLKDFRHAFESMGNNSAVALLKKVHPLVPFYETHIKSYEQDGAMTKNIRELLMEHDTEITEHLKNAPLQVSEEEE